MENITKDNIISAINEIISHPELRKGRTSTTYDLIYEGKDYPPKLVISIANKFANGTELKPEEFQGGENTEAFNLLRKYGFEIVNKYRLDGFKSKFYEEAKSLEPIKFDYYINLLKEVCQKFKLNIDDPRIVFTCRHNQLNFIVGQRYAITVKNENEITYFGVISKNKLNNESEKFEGNSPAFYTTLENIEELNKYKEIIFEKIKEELNRTNSSSFKKYDNLDFRELIFTNIMNVQNNKIKIWVEKTIIKDRNDRLSGERALGKVLWSPERDKRGADIYKNMRLVNQGDIILHLVDNLKFLGISVAKNKFIQTTGIEGTEWDGPAYLIELENYKELKPPIERSDLLIAENKKILDEISLNSEVFYNEILNLRQGAYLTPCPIKLFLLINEIYKKNSSVDLPFRNQLSIDISNKDIMINFDLKKVKSDLSNSGLKTNDNIIIRFTSSLLTKPFVILTGLSGSGKTKLAQAFAMWICENDEQYCIVPVGADWTNREPLLGFPNALIDNDYKKDEYGVLKLIIEANTNSDKPYFLILDEMNLSHVERYFADFLSVMESKSKISLHSGNEDWNSVPSEIGFPKNLFIIGTVNIDETTYMFSPKVLDRANVIEFRVTKEEMENYLQSNSVINLDNLEGLGANMAGSFVEIAKDDSLEASDTEELNKSLMSFFSELKKTGAEFGYRSASEILRFAAVVNKIETTWNMTDIIDAAIMQKLLPKVHGSRRKLEPVLKTLGQLCLQDGQKFDDLLIAKTEIDFKDVTKIKYAISLEKILRMYDNLISNGFTSYAEA